MNFDLKNFLKQQKAELGDEYSQEDAEVEFDTSSTNSTLEEGTQSINFGDLSMHLGTEGESSFEPQQDSLDEIIQKSKTVKTLFGPPSEPSELGLPPAVIEDLILKFLYLFGSLPGKELSTRIRLPLHTVLDPSLERLSDGEYIFVSKSSGIGGINKVYQTTAKGNERAQQAIKSSRYVGPAPVSLSDYIQAVNQYPPIAAPSLQELKKNFKEMVLHEAFLEQIGAAFASGASAFLYGPSGSGKSTIAKNLRNLCHETIRIPYAIYVNRAIVSMFDPSVHQPVDPNYSLDQPLPINNQVDCRWIEIYRPCVLMNADLTSAALKNPQFDDTGSLAYCAVTTKANGGLFVIDDLGRQLESPTPFFTYLLHQLEHREELFTMRSGQQYRLPYKAFTLFISNILPQKLLDEFFLKRIAYKIKVPDISLEEYCQIFVNESERNHISWQDDTLEYLLQVYYTKAGRALSPEHPQIIIARIMDILRFQEASKPYTLTRDLIDRAWKLHFL